MKQHFLFCALRAKHLTLLCAAYWLMIATASAQTTHTQTFNYTGNAQEFTVPPGVMGIHVIAWAASGGSGHSAIISLGGKGGKVETDLSVTPGETLTIYAGGAPAPDHAAGYNGGGSGYSDGSPASWFGGGGGGTDIRRGGTSLTHRVVVSGGGGGTFFNYVNPGDGGGLVGRSIPTGGKGGTQSAGGAGYNGGQSGSLGQGGNSATVGCGGGGGYYGGGGTYLAAQAGGGSSYTDPVLCTNVIHTQGEHTGNGKVTISWIHPQHTWTGTVNTDWDEPGNWDIAFVPTADYNVIIPNVPNDPVIGNSTAALAKSVSVQSDAELTINTGGSLTISGSTGNGLDNSGGSVQNNGVIHIDATGQSGINNSNGTIYNSGEIHIGQQQITIGYNGINNGGTFTNESGQIRIDRSSHGIQHNSGVFTNRAALYIGAEAGVRGTGIYSSAFFLQESGGVLHIDGAGANAITNYNTFTNRGEIRIGGAQQIGSWGIYNSNTFNNDGTGEIWIDRTAGIGLYTDHPFHNRGKLYIGLLAPIGQDGIKNYGEFTNHACAEIRLHSNLNSNTSYSFINRGLFTVDTDKPHTFSGSYYGLENFGILEYVQGNPIPNVDNRCLIVQPIGSECGPVSSALQIGIQNRFAAGVTWYLDESLTQPAGVYNQAANTFTPDNLPQGTQQLYFNAHDDGYGCSRVVSVRLTLDDQTPPVAICQDITVHPDDSGNVGTNAQAVNNGSTDACGIQTMHLSQTIFNCAHIGPNTVTLTVTDIGGNQNSCTATVTVQDNLFPTVTCPGPVTVSCAGNVPAAAPSQIMANDNCGIPGKSHLGDVTYDQTCPNRFKITRSYCATDLSGNSSTCTQTITVYDGAQPGFSFVPGNTTVQCHQIPAPGNPTATDNCGGSVTIAFDGETVSNLICDNSYTLTRQWTATDACGNTKTATQRITVRDTQKPVFTATPANITVQCSNIPAPAGPTATDNCDATVTISYNGESRTNGACTDTYVLTRKWTAADNCGNTKTVTQKITVQDTQKPAFTAVPANITIQCSETLPDVGPAIATDNCDAAVTLAYLGQSSANAGCQNSYQLIRTWKATDNCGNFTVTSQTITIQDTQAPVFTSVPAHVTIQCHELLPPIGTPTAADACGGYVQITFLGQTSAAGNCLGNYTITRSWRAQDVCGNSVTAGQLITIQDTQAPNFTNAPANVTIACGGALPGIPALMATDNCDNIVPVTYLGEESTGPDCPYTVTRTWTVSDDCGNSRVHTQVITVGNAFEVQSLKFEEQKWEFEVQSLKFEEQKWEFEVQSLKFEVQHTEPQFHPEDLGSNSKLHPETSGSNFKLHPEDLGPNYKLHPETSGSNSKLHPEDWGPNSKLQTSYSELRTSNFELQTSNSPLRTLNFELQTSPNPARDEVWLSFESISESEATIRLFDAAGRLAHRQVFGASIGDNRYRLDLSGLPGGLYTMHVQVAAWKTAKKLVIVKN